jgi:integrase
VREATLPESRNRAIISAIVALAEAMGMETTAEGIESHDQLDLVRALRVSHIQGYIYSKPLAGGVMAERLERGDWSIKPAGPAKQRSQRHSMFRKVGIIVGNRYAPGLIRNLSETGALIDGLGDLAIGAPMIVDFGDGQLACARVCRARNRQYGVEFEHPMVNDGSGGFCTRHRVSAYQLRAAGIPSNGGAESVSIQGVGDDALEGLRAKLGLNAPSRTVLAPVGFLVTQAGGFEGDAGNSDDTGGGTARLDAPATTTFEDLANQYLDGIRDDPHKAKVDSAHLRQHILPRFGRLRPDDVTPSLVTAWLEQKVKEVQLPSSRVGEIQAIFAQLYMLAMQCGMSDDGTADKDMAIINGAQVHERRLTPEEVTRLKAAAQSSSNAQMRVIVPLLMLTRTRLRELVDACWDQLDLDAAKWHIPGGAYGKERSVKLCTEALTILADLPRWPDCDRLIINPATGRPYRSFAESWNTLRLKAALPDLEMDDLRHCAAGEDDDRVSTAPKNLVAGFLKRTKSARNS